MHIEIKGGSFCLRSHLHTHLRIHLERVSMTILNKELTKMLGKQGNKSMQIRWEGRKLQPEWVMGLTIIRDEIHSPLLNIRKTTSNIPSTKL
jgi:hypothetical protein